MLCTIFGAKQREFCAIFGTKQRELCAIFGAKQRGLCAVLGAKVSIENNLLFGTTCFEKSGSNLRKKSL